MGAGKSTLGSALGAVSCRPWIDTDQWIEQRTGLSIPDLVAKEGWDFFRSLEAAFIHEFSFQGPSILSTGGGFPLQEANKTWLKEHATTFYLSVDRDTLYERLLPEKEFRPLLQNIPDVNLKAYLEETLSHRESVYRMADYVLDGTLPIPLLVEEIQRLI